jgi:transposase
VRRRKVSRGEAQRAEIVLRGADGLNNRAISDAVGVARDTVRMWRGRFAKHGLDGLDDVPSGRDAGALEETAPDATRFQAV